MNIGDKVRKYRTLSGLSAAELGMKVGFSHRDIGEYIRAYEAGKVKPCRATRERLAKALNIPERRMLDREIETEDDIDFILEELIEDDGFSCEVIHNHLKKYSEKKKKPEADEKELSELKEIYTCVIRAKQRLSILMKLLFSMKLLARKTYLKVDVIDAMYETVSLVMKDLCEMEYRLAQKIVDLKENAKI